jgi:hypothetical protein
MPMPKDPYVPPQSVETNPDKAQLVQGVVIDDGDDFSSNRHRACEEMGSETGVVGRFASNRATNLWEPGFSWQPSGSGPVLPSFP